MVEKTLDIRKKAQLLGILFAEYGILTTEQASIVKNFIDRPMKNFANPDSLWTFYNAITIALQQSHPRTWMEDQRVLHYFIDSIYKFPKHTTTAAIAPVTVVTPVEDEVVVEAEEKGPEMDQEASENIPNPNQINIFDVIAEEEEMAVCPPPVEEPELSELAIERDNIKADIEADIIDEDIRYAAMEEPEVESEFAAEDNIDEVVVYTDPAGNTFEAPVVETSPIEHQVHDFSEKEKLSLDDILIRIPNEEKAKEEEPDFSLDFSSSDDEEDSDFTVDLF